MSLLIQLVSLIVLGFFVVKRGEDTTWKLIYAGIIAAPMILGFALTILIQSLMGSPDNFAIAVGLILGYIGLAVSGIWSYWRRGGIYKGKKRTNHSSDKTVV